MATVLATVGCNSSEPGGGGGSGGSTGSGGAGSGGAGTGSGGSIGSGGSGGAGSGGSTGSGRSTGSGGSNGTGGRVDGGSGGSGGATTDAAGDSADVATETPPAGARFSFFVTSLEAMRALSGSQNGFGGDLGGLTGADEICRKTAERGLPGAGAKTWRAFLSTVGGGPGGGPVHAIDRIGNGPWYDRMERLVAPDKASLLGSPRPRGGDPRVASDMPNENGFPQKPFGDNHDVLTGSDRQGHVLAADRGDTCNDWTSKVGTTGSPAVGHSWPRTETTGVWWIFDHIAPGCAAGVNLIQNGGGMGNCVGCAGGYGGLYCFALTP